MPDLHHIYQKMCSIYFQIIFPNQTKERCSLNTLCSQSWSACTPSNTAFQPSASDEPDFSHHLGQYCELKGFPHGSCDGQMPSPRLPTADQKTVGFGAGNQTNYDGQGRKILKSKLHIAAKLQTIHSKIVLWHPESVNTVLRMQILGTAGYIPRTYHFEAHHTTLHARHGNRVSLDDVEFPSMEIME